MGTGRDLVGRGLAGGFLVGIGLICALLWPRPAAPGLERFSSSHYAEIGESLIHGLREPDIDVSHRLPLSTMSAAALVGHAGLSSQSLKARLGVLLAVAAFAAGAVLQPWAGVVPLAAAAGAWSLRHGGLFETLPELLFSILLLLVAGLLSWRARAPSPKRSLLLACALGTTLLFRSVLIFFPPLLAAFEALGRRGRTTRKDLSQAAVLCVVPYLFLLPWIAMNYSLRNGFVPVERGAANINIATAVYGLTQASSGSPHALIDTPRDVDKGGGILRWAAGEIARHPVRYFAGYLRRLRFVFDMQPLLYLLAAASLIFRRRPEHRQTAFLAAYVVLIYCTMSVVDRYMQPLCPLLILLAFSSLGPRLEEEMPAERSTRALGELLLGAGLGVVLAASLGAVWSLAAYASAADPAGAAEFSKAIGRYPGDPWLRLRDGERLLGEGRFNEASAEFARAAELRPGDPEPILREAWAQALDGRPAALLAWKPLDDSRDASNLYLNIDARVYAASALLESGRKAEAREQLELAWAEVRDIPVRGSRDQLANGEEERDVLTRLEGREEHFTDIAFELLRDQPARTRLRLAEGLAEVFPRSSAVLIEEARLNLKAGETEAARALVPRVEALRPGDHDLFALASIDRELDEPAKAAKILEPLAIRFPELAAELAAVRAEAADYATIAEGRVRAKDYHAAIAILESRVPSMKSVHELRRAAKIFGDMNRHARETELLREAAQMNPRSPDSWIDLAAAADKAGNGALAKSSLERASGLPLEPEEQDRLAIAYQSRKAFARALAIFDSLVRRSPGSAKYLNDRGVCRYLGGDAAGAVEDLKAALRFDPRLEDAKSSLAAIAH
ncbi:MAG TPA: hypothetical protein VN915_12405 [Elusimicrobiota bacterium]|nr:hypothetical protein [Elusimicrobiota bacterium]